MGTLKEQYPLIFDDTTIPFYPSGYVRSDEKVSVVNQTEDGHDDVEITRVEKTTLELSFLVNAHWAAILKGFQRKASISVQIYDKVNRAYETKLMRIEGYTEDLEQYSDRNQQSMGLYTVSFSLVEF